MHGESGQLREQKGFKEEVTLELPWHNTGKTGRKLSVMGESGVEPLKWKL